MTEEPAWLDRLCALSEAEDPRALWLADARTVQADIRAALVRLDYLTGRDVEFERAHPQAGPSGETAGSSVSEPKHSH